MAEAAEQKKRAPIITPQRMRLAEYQRQDWVANVEYGVTLEDIKDPGFWAHMAQHMKPYDHVEVRAEDGAWIAYLIVTGCDRTWARVVVDRVVNLTTKDVALSQHAAAKHEVAFKGPHHKYSVIRLSDRQMVRKGFDTEQEALAWMREHEHTTA
jgi:hypothetical protein